MANPSLTASTRCPGQVCMGTHRAPGALFLWNSRSAGCKSASHMLSLPFRSSPRTLVSATVLQGRNKPPSYPPGLPCVRGCLGVSSRTSECSVWTPHCMGLLHEARAQNVAGAGQGIPPVWLRLLSSLANLHPLLSSSPPRTHSQELPHILGVAHSLIAEIQTSLPCPGPLRPSPTPTPTRCSLSSVAPAAYGASLGGADVESAHWGPAGKRNWSPESGARALVGAGSYSKGPKSGQLRGK